MSDITTDLRKKRVLGGILNKHRLTKGWAMLSVEDADLMTMAWIQVLDLERIPDTAYEAIYNGAMRKISSMVADGKKPPDFDANLMASIWRGDRDLREMFTPRVTHNIGMSSGGCSRCLGTGWEYMKTTYPREVARCRCGKIPGM